MKKHLGGAVCTLLILSFTIISWRSPSAHISTVKFSSRTDAKELLQKYVDNIYETAHLQDAGLGFTVFKKAVTGFLNLKLSNKLPQNSAILTVIDFSKSSSEKRMWIIDMIGKELIMNTWVAHGSGSGDEIPQYFSDNNDSHQSSLGFYITDDIYYGKHGRSLRLDGLDTGFNASARARDIVIHAAKYVSQKAINRQGHIGRSFGCPAVSPKVADRVIETLKNKTMLFINGNDDTYFSKYLDEDMAANFVSADTSNSVLANL